MRISIITCVWLVLSQVYYIHLCPLWMKTSQYSAWGGASTCGGGANLLLTGAQDPSLPSSTSIVSESFTSLIRSLQRRGEFTIGGVHMYVCVCVHMCIRAMCDLVDLLVYVEVRDMRDFVTYWAVPFLAQWRLLVVPHVLHSLPDPARNRHTHTHR